MLASGSHSQKVIEMGSKVFVGNLDFNTTKTEVQTLFSEIGEIRDVFLPTDRESGRPRGFAFVAFANDADAAKALAAARDAGVRRFVHVGTEAALLAGEPLVKYMLMGGEAKLTEEVRGTSGFAEEFVRRGPRDRRGRSLRDLDLRSRLFRYPCSYLIYSDAVDALPEPTKEYLYRRLHEVLTGRDRSPEFARLSAADRAAILAILLATKPGLPDDWRRATADPQ